LANGIWIGDLRVAIHWNRWDIGMSVFIPCTDVSALRPQIRKRARAHGYKLVDKEELAGGLIGLRFWRVE